MAGETLLTIAFIVFVVWLVVSAAAVGWWLLRGSGRRAPGQGKAAFWTFMSALGGGGLFQFLGIKRMPRPPREREPADPPRQREAPDLAAPPHATARRPDDSTDG